MAVATDVRLAFAGQVQTLLLASGLVDDTFEVVAGRREGPQTDKDRGSVWVAVVEPDDPAVLEIVELHLRVFKRRFDTRGSDLKPFDPTVLEGIGETVQSALNTAHITVDSFGGWYEFARQEFDVDQQYVEITVPAHVRQRFAPPGS